MIRITADIVLDDSEIQEEFVRASGPGGQNVNKVSTAVKLRFDAGNSPALSEEIRQRLRALAGRRMTRQGVLVIDARRHRTQDRNRQDAMERLTDLIRQAAVRPRRRIPTKPTLASRRRRLDCKRRRGQTKDLRRPVPGDGE